MRLFYIEELTFEKKERRDDILSKKKRQVPSSAFEQHKNNVT